MGHGWRNANVLIEVKGVVKKSILRCSMLGLKTMEEYDVNQAVGSLPEARMAEAQTP